MEITSESQNESMIRTAQSEDESEAHTKHVNTIGNKTDGAEQDGATAHQSKGMWQNINKATCRPVLWEPRQEGGIRGKSRIFNKALCSAKSENASLIFFNPSS